jgi:UDP-N-acetylglucosamine acyltransferase
MSKIHPTAQVDSKAEIGEGTEIGPFCVVGPHVRLGKNNILKSHVVIENHTTVGDGNTIYPFAIIGAAPADLKYKGEPTELVIGNNNCIRESTSLHIGTAGGGGVTRVGNDNLLMAYVHLGHDTILGNRVIIANGCQLAGHVTVEDWAILGGLSAVSQFCRVGAHSYVGGMSGVDRDMLPYTLGKGTTGQFQIMGLNLVGLRRRGVAAEIIGKLNDAVKIFSNKDYEKAAALAKMEELYGTVAEVRELCEFIKKSEVGVFR